MDNQNNFSKNETDLTKKLASILFLYREPIKLSKLKEFLDEESLDLESIQEGLKALEEKLASLGLVLVELSAKKETEKEYKLALAKDFLEIRERIKQEELAGSLTPASLQVLTICAYLGASTKNQISFIRGVQSTQSIRSLMTRGLLKKIGDKYVLSIDALQSLGVKKIEDLPEYEKIKADFKERVEDLIISEKEEAA